MTKDSRTQAKKQNPIKLPLDTIHVNTLMSYTTFNNKIPVFSCQRQIIELLGSGNNREVIQSTSR